MNKRGSITIEGAIAFGIVLIFVLNIVTFVKIQRTDMIMQSSVEATCEKIAVYAPLSVTASDVIFTIVNALPDSAYTENAVTNLITGVASAIVGLDQYSGMSLSSMVLTGVFGGLIRDDIANEFVERNKSKYGMPESIDVECSFNPYHNIIEVCVTYKMDTLIGVRERSIYSVIPLYGDISLMINDEGDNSSSDNDIWSRDNFTRGDYFRAEYGANLPKTFPVIDSYSNGEVESILSIDLTAPTYTSGNEAAYKRLCDEVDKISQFDGADVMINGSRYTVDSNSITGRSIKVIVPENSEGTVLGELYSATNYAKDKGISITIYKNGESIRYN